MKRIRLNTFFFLCLSAFICISFLLLYINSVKIFNKFKTYSIDKTVNSIKKFSDSTFAQDVKQQTLLVDQELKNAVNTLRYVRLSIYELLNTKLYKTNNDLDLKYDNTKNLYKYLDSKSVRTINEYRYGFIVDYWPGDNKEKDMNVIKKINILSAMKPQLMEPFVGDHNAIISTFIMGKENFIIAYSRSPEKILEKLDSKFFLSEVKSVFSNNYSQSHFKFSNVFKSLDGTRVISLLMPVYDSQGKIIYIVGAVLNYDKIISKLYDVFSNLDYKKFNIIRLFINDQGNIIYLSSKYYNLFSLTQNMNKKTLFHGQYSNNIFKTSLLDSTDPKVRKLATYLINNKFEEKTINLKGEEYLLIFETFNINNWTMAVLMKTDELYKPLNITLEKFQTISNVIHRRYIINFLIILILGLIVSFLFFKYIFIKPIESLRNKVRILGSGNFDIKIKEAGIREIYDLAKSFNNLGGQLKEYMENLAREIKGRQSIETELKIAGDLQESVLPKITDEFKRNEFELYANLIPAKEMSGDFFDFFFLNEDLLTIVVADVSGKGITAAFYMSMAKAIIKDKCYSSNSQGPAKILEKVNDILSCDNESMMFLTAYLIFYNIKTGELIYANAGHHEYITVDNTGKAISAGIANCTAIGIFEDVKYKNFKIQLDPEQVFAVYTDGITEAPDTENIEFGTDRLEDIFRNKYKLSLTDLGDTIIENVLEYQNKEKFDDITLLMLKRKIVN